MFPDFPPSDSSAKTGNGRLPIVEMVPAPKNSFFTAPMNPLLDPSFSAALRELDVDSAGLVESGDSIRSCELATPNASTAHVEEWPARQIVKTKIEYKLRFILRRKIVYL
jgi:hypothetical protein